MGSCILAATQGHSRQPQYKEDNRHNPQKMNGESDPSEQQHYQKR
jgi:hypothetical protein